MNFFLKPFISWPLRHIYSLIFQRWYRSYCWLSFRLNRVPRFTEKNIDAAGFILDVPDCASFLSGFKEIFVENCYAFTPRSNTPRILDLGANIGLSILFFKKEYPGAEIEALEADPAIFHYLQKNVRGNGFSDVQLFNNAAWYENTTLEFQVEGADGGRIAKSVGGHVINVTAIDMYEFMSDRHYDLLKMDIEGAEVDVVRRCRDKLFNVDHLFVEYHSVVNEKQRLDELLEILTSVGFRYHIHSPNPAKSPFISINQIVNYDMLLNVFAWRDKADA